MNRVLYFLGAQLIRVLHATLRVRHIGSENIENVSQYIVAFWHAHLLLMLHARYRKPIVVLISQSKDGELIARVFDWYGVDSARGSSTRGATGALREILRAAQSGANIAFTPDGPKGPPRVAKDGVVYAAQATGLPIIPVAFAAKKKSCCGPGTGWSCRSRLRGPSSFTARQSWFRAMETWKSAGGRSRTA